MIKKVVTFILFFLAFIFFMLLAFHTLDPDFGWHYEMGKYILSYGIPFHDPFSYTMPSYLFIDHEWMTNVGIFFISNRSTWILSLLWTIILFGALFIPLSFKRNAFTDSLFFISLAVIVSFFRINPQVISWLFFSVLILILFHDGLWNRYKYVLPILVVIWVNIHGSFAISVALISIKCVVETIEKRKLIPSSIFVFVLSWGATCINPYGLRIWHEVWSQMTDSNLHWEIGEWKSPLLVFDIVPWVLYAFSVGAFIKFRKTFSLIQQTLFVLIFLLSLTAERHVPLFLIVALYILNISLGKFQQSLSKDQHERLLVITPIFLVLSIIFFVIRAMFFYPTIIQSSESSYPQYAVRYIKDHMIRGQVFTVYQWGGYFLWKLPEKKDFIDGRMPSWRRSTAPPYESMYAMKEYNALLSDPKKNLLNTIKKYDITYFVLPNPVASSPSPFINKVRTTLHLQSIVVAPPSLYSKLITQLQKEHEPMLYQDSVARIYKVTQAQ